MESGSWHECFPSEGSFSRLSLLTGLFLSSPSSLVFIVSGITNQVDDGVSRKPEFCCMESQRHVKNETSLEKIKQQQKLVKKGSMTWRIQVLL